MEIKPISKNIKPQIFLINHELDEFVILTGGWLFVIISDFGVFSSFFLGVSIYLVVSYYQELKKGFVEGTLLRFQYLLGFGKKPKYYPPSHIVAFGG